MVLGGVGVIAGPQQIQIRPIHRPAIGDQDIRDRLTVQQGLELGSHDQTAFAGRAGRAISSVTQVVAAAPSC